MEIQKSIYLNKEDIINYIEQSTKFDLFFIEEKVKIRRKEIDKIDQEKKEKQDFWDNTICEYCEKINKDCNCLPF